MICSRNTILVVALSVLVARVTGLHIHLCPHDEGLQKELHTFTHEEVGCSEPNNSEPEPTDLELDASDEGSIKTLKFGLDMLAVSPMVAAAATEPLADLFNRVAQTPTPAYRRALRPPLRGPPA